MQVLDDDFGEIIAKELTNDNDWKYISRYHILCDRFLETFLNKLHWDIIPHNDSFTTNMTIKYWNYIKKKSVIYTSNKNIDQCELYKLGLLSENDLIDSLTSKVVGR